MKRMMIKPIVSLFFSLAVSAAVSVVRADMVILKSGEMFQTRKAWTQGSQVLFYQNDRIVRIDQNDVERVIEDSGPHDRGSTGGHPAPAPLPSPGPPAAQVVPPTVPVPAGDTGYRGFHWGMTPAHIQGQGWIPIETDPAYGGVHEYVLAEGAKRFGSARVDGIRLGFWQGGLYTIVVEVGNFLDFRELKAETFRRYGRGLQRRAKAEVFHWTDAEADRLLAYDVDTDAGYLWMRSRALHDRVKATYPDAP